MSYIRCHLVHYKNSQFSFGKEYRCSEEARREKTSKSFSKEKMVSDLEGPVSGPRQEESGKEASAPYKDIFIGVTGLGPISHSVQQQLGGKTRRGRTRRLKVLRSGHEEPCYIAGIQRTVRNPSRRNLA